jgi:hypothetical protein
MNPIYERMAPTTTALQSATFAVRSPYPSAALSVLQPKLRQVVEENDRVLRDPPADTPRVGIDSLKRSNELLRYAATIDPKNYQSFLERLEGAAKGAAETATDVGKLAVVGLALIALIFIFK